MKDSNNGSSTLVHKQSAEEEEEEGEGAAVEGLEDAEANQRLINQLRARIVELEMRGDHLKMEKEQLEVRFQLGSLEKSVALQFIHKRCLFPLRVNIRLKVKNLL